LELAGKTGNKFDLRTEGLLNLCKTHEGLDHEVRTLAAVANELGIEAQVLNAKETAAMEPRAHLEVAGSVYFPIDAHLIPGRFMVTLIDLLKEQGVTFHWNTNIVGWRRDGTRIAAVVTSRGELVADEYVLTAGSWAADTLRGLRIRLPMQPGRGYSLTMERPPFHLTKPMILSERRVALTPMGQRLRFGGTMELSGHNGLVLNQRIEQIITAARSYLPDLEAKDFAGIEPWFGYRPLSPDGMPYLGRFAAFSNFTAACGHAMLGVTLAPVTGLIVAEILTARKPSIDIKLLDPDRFA
jgi:D-amino-acid dehydrogenase